MKFHFGILSHKYIKSHLQRV